MLTISLTIIMALVILVLALAIFEGGLSALIALFIIFTVVLWHVS